MSVSSVVHLALIGTIISSQIIQIPYYKVGISLKIKCRLGNDPYDTFLQMDFDNKINWLDQSHNPSKEATILSEEEHKGGITYKLIIEKFKMEKGFENSLENYFFLFNRLFENRWDSLTFSREIYQDFNLVHMLYYKKIIPELCFGLYSINPEEGILSLGGIPKEIALDSVKKSCSISSRSPKWGCNLKAVQVGDKTFENTFYSFFQTQGIFINAPKEFMKFFLENYFNYYLSSQLCRLDKGDNSYKCYCAVKENFPEISFYFNELKFQFKEKLFKEEKDECIFLIRENEKDGDTWEFGQVFILQNPMLFNYKDNTISFYFKESSPFVGRKKNYVTLFTVNILLLLFSSAMLFYCKYAYYSMSDSKFLGYI